MIKNDPKKYVTRAGLIPRPPEGWSPPETRTLDDYLRAEIDDAGYIRFPREEDGRGPAR